MSEQNKKSPKWVLNSILYGGLFVALIFAKAVASLLSVPADVPQSQASPKSEQSTEEPEQQTLTTIKDDCTEGVLTCSIDTGYSLLTLGIEARTDHFYAQAQASGNARQYLAEHFLINKQLLEQAQVRYGSFGGDATQIAYVRDRLGDMTAILAAFEKINLGHQALGQGVAVNTFMDQADEVEVLLIREFPSLAEEKQLTRVDPIQERELNRTEVATHE